MDYSFRSCRIGAKRWSMVLCDTYNFRRVVWSPGYESTKLGDILKADWYLNGGFRGNLPEHTIALLDQIRESIPEQYREKMYYK